jgi:hypothetical protein
MQRQQALYDGDVPMKRWDRPCVWR